MFMLNYLFLSYLSFLSLTKCKKLTVEENLELQRSCGRNMTFPTEYSRKVLNGYNITSKYEAPWSISVKIKSRYSLEKSQCSGTLISKRHVLTARHCFLHDADRWNQLKWITDDTTWNKHEFCDGHDLIVPERVKELADFMFRHCSTCHPVQNYFWRYAKKIILPGLCKPQKYGWDTNDLAIVELDEDVEFSEAIRPVCVSNSSEDQKIGANIVLYGYGVDRAIEGYSAGTLRYEISRIDECDNECNKEKWFCSRSLTEIQMGCVGDSGAGALLKVNDSITIVGVFSAGPYCEKTSRNEIDIMVPIRDNIDRICAHTGICFENFSSQAGFSFFGVGVISVELMVIGWYGIKF